MPGPKEGEKHKILPIIYMIDNSGSMNDDGRIEAVNDGMKESRLIIDEVAKSNTNADISLAVMSFNSNVEWVQELIDVADFEWQDLVAYGLTNLGEALNELDKKLSRHGEGFLTDPIGYKIPVIILMSDGYPNDDWQIALENIRNNNKWFKHAIKIAIGMGKDFDESVLITFTGTREAVFRNSDRVGIVELLKNVADAASKIGSTSHAGSPDPTRELVRAIRNNTLEEEGAEFSENSDASDPGENTPDSGTIPSGFDMDF